MKKAYLIYGSDNFGQKLIGVSQSQNGAEELAHTWLDFEKDSPYVVDTDTECSIKAISKQSFLLVDDSENIFAEANIKTVPLEEIL